jgi:ribosomal protein S18 acetylase RimI-like enzyme
MDYKITKTEQGDELWHHIIENFPQTILWLEDPQDEGNYNCFVAVGESGEFLGLSVIDIAPLAFGPLADEIIGFLEEVTVPESYRRKGIGTSLLEAALEQAWRNGARHVRWIVGYDNPAGIALSRKAGAAFVPEEDPESGSCYTAVVTAPAGKNL